ncbi:MAG TPA: hypothetical protein VFB58_04900 [Chloroflexota bacterium]|nr:hypothetical protein [Chloroflexota bacterium]
MILMEGKARHAAAAIGLAAVVGILGLLGPGAVAARSPAASHVAQTPSCPSTLSPGTTAAAAVPAAIARDMPNLYNHAPGHTNYKIVAMASLASGAQSDAINSFVAVYRGIAMHRCGSTVAGRSWVVLLYFPHFKPSASMSEGVVYVARTLGGWHVWYVYH